MIETRPDIAATFSALMFALDELTAPYVPPPEEVEHLQAALGHLVAAYDRRDFQDGEEAVWNCGSLVIGGAHGGAWEIRLSRTDRDSDGRR